LKRLFAITLLSVHLFYLGGYSLLFQYYIHQSDVQMVKQIYDNKIDAAKLIEIKIPVNLPNIENWNEYEVVQGQIQLKDTYYNYVRLKMTRDTMFFICIPNTVKTRLVTANVIMAKEINDVPLSKKGHDGSSKKVNVLSDYNYQSVQFKFLNFATLIKPVSIPVALNLIQPYLDAPGKPPDFIS
jgi:hypothetical protein